MEIQVFLLVVNLCLVIVCATVHGSEGYNISPSPATLPAFPPVEERRSSQRHHGKSTRANVPSASPLPHVAGSNLHPPIISLPLKSAPVPKSFKRLVASMPPNPPIEVPSHKLTLLPQNAPKIAPSMQPRRSPHRRTPYSKLPVSAPYAPVPAVSSMLTPPPAIGRHRSGFPLASPPEKIHHHFPPVNQSPPKGPSINPIQPPMPSTFIWDSPAPSPLSTAVSDQTKSMEGHVLPPAISPTTSSRSKPKRSTPSPVQALPPPPPNQDCTSLTCIEPLTNSPPGSPCRCVWPMQVGLRLSVALYTFFPLVSELAKEIAGGVFMKLSQVRVMGANAASQQLDKTVVLIDLVSLGENFDNTTAFLTYERFWKKQVAIKTSFFGDYEVLYVHYPGLPPSPPSAPSIINSIDGPYTGRGNNARAIHPLGVDVSKTHKGGLGGSTIAIIVLSSFVALVLCVGITGLFLLKYGEHIHLSAPNPLALGPSLTKQTGAARSLLLGTGFSSASLSFGSSITTYTGTARTFTADEIVRYTDNFNDSRILGEGGFGRVYKAILDDGTEVAAKVLKRDDQQGGREFLAEIEMLSRLHHRNLVKLIGICTEDHARCLIYELIRNGSVESHLHGVDKESAPLDWGARIKIALGAARGLAYLHEDSSPHVIHRDFKSSNILLEHDFTPKVSDFGLARTALDEGNKHISTRVMGTFGYVAPEYAMTGHLLVKSDVYSYGVVLLELLTGRKPVNLSQPQGQENLVAWARPLLTSKEGLEMLIDPALGSDVSFDSVAKVAAIASMCVQPEVSHRPFMGEVVQALKLVCNECDESKKTGLESCDQEEYSATGTDARTSMDSRQIADPSSSQCHDYNSSPDGDITLSASDIFSTSVKYARQMSGSFRRHSSSGPLRTGRSRQFWQRVRSMSRGSLSEHGTALGLGSGSS
ncbi:hypothetical protein GIB67_038135 [Kingdonia uniflora]|uniref:Protein kinase domain-containing protein n=1 Tax=Kingdonia uniflora TaxID=39325 RepID=A0A7J7M1T2_9MAGN|nr:hypothetical protein GIB67_038135 [Kingdonia uniflora]